MNKFETIERDLIEFKLRFSHWTPERMLNIQEESNTLDILLESNKNDKDALELIKSIENDLEKYFLYLINQIDFELIKNNSLNNYNNKLESLEKNYLQSQTDDQINNLNLKIINDRNKYPSFIEIFEDTENTGITNPSDNFKRTIAKKSKQFYLNSNLSPTNKILNTTNYYLDLSDFISKNVIYQKLKTPSLFVLFKDLFESTELYDKAVNNLIENNFIEKGKYKLKWIFTPTNKFTTNQTIIALCVVLEIKHYFKHNPKAIYTNIKNEFNIGIDKGTYSKSSNSFKKDFNTSKTTTADYISLFKDIL